MARGVCAVYYWNGARRSVVQTVINVELNMKKENLNIDPQSIGERWYQHTVNQSKDWWQCIIPLIVITTFTLYLYSSSSPKQQSDQLLFFFILWLSFAMLNIERYYGYKILKRKLDEISNLKEEK